MRYRFFQPTDDEETGAYLRQMNIATEFWQRFRQVCGRRASSWVSELREQLSARVPELGLEVRESNTGQRCLYVVPVQGPEDLPLAKAFVERAPETAGWAFAVEREPLDLLPSLAATQADFGLDLSRARVRVGVGRGHGLEVVVGSELFAGLDQETDLDAAHQLLNHLLGDSLMHHWVCNVSTLTQPKPSPLRILGADKQLLPLELRDLVPSVEAAVRGIDEGLPEQPCHTHCEHADWVMFDCAADAKGAVPSGSDVPTAAAADLLMVCTMRPEMLKWHLQGGQFSSRRFSRRDEHFCYLRLPSGDDIKDAAEQRVALEEQLDRWLVPGKLGCVVGGGPGHMHQYIHLALTELDHTITLLGQKLPGFAPSGAALLFCDSEWEHEWVGFGSAQALTRPSSPRAPTA